jgi:hypothetical protein
MGTGRRIWLERMNNGTRRDSKQLFDRFSFVRSTIDHERGAYITQKTSQHFKGSDPLQGPFSTDNPHVSLRRQSIQHPIANSSCPRL